MKEKRIKIGFIGAGSIGSLFGGLISSIQSEKYVVTVILFGRKNHIEAINRNGLTIQTDQKVYNIKKIQAFDNPDLIEDIIQKNSDFAFDFVFLTTKAYDTRSALMQYKNIVTSSKWVIILQNGIGNEEIVKEFCSGKKIVRAVTTFGAHLKETGLVLLTGLGTTKLGFIELYNQRLKKEESNAELELAELNEILNLAGLNSIIVDDILRVCWEKAFVNIGINAFGALTRLTNGELLECQEINRLMREAVDEAVKIAKLKNISIEEKDYFYLVSDVANKTSKNKSSMLQDVLKNKITEIDYINGKIVEYAKQLDMKVPINETLTNLVKGLEASNLSA